MPFDFVWRVSIVVVVDVDDDDDIDYFTA